MVFEKQEQFNNICPTTSCTQLWWDLHKTSEFPLYNDDTGRRRGIVNALSSRGCNDFTLYISTPLMRAVLSDNIKQEIKILKSVNSNYPSFYRPYLTIIILKLDRNKTSFSLFYSITNSLNSIFEFI